MKTKINQEEIVNHLKSTGFIFSNSEIYNGLANAWDYGPLGALLKRNLKNLWWKEFITKDKNVVALDSSILMNSMVWKASGHLDNFSDPLIDCKACKSRFRADKLIEENVADIIVSETTSNDDIQKILKDYQIFCPNCKKFEWTDVRYFNLMFKTHQGVIEESKNELYLRPETAQGIFVNFKNIQRTMRLKLPFGVGQIGKSFRNEITPGNFIFRTREFEQMELEYFLEEKDAYKYFDFLEAKIEDFLINKCALKENNLKKYNHSKDELSHYSKKTIDFQFNFPHGFSELWGLAYRTNYDLTTHMNYSKKDLTYLDPITNEKIIAHVVEPSVGVERLIYAICYNAYEIQTLDDKSESRVVMRLPYDLAPYKACVMPLTNKLNETAENIYDILLKQGLDVIYDASGSIGKRYRRQDAIGTPYCITVDFDSLEKQTVTIRNRDSMKQEIIKISDLNTYFYRYS